MKIEFLKKLDTSIYILIIGFIVLLKFISYVVYPYVGGDGVWAMSQAFSYYNGLTDSSIFAHEYLGNIFTIHLLDFFYSIWFKLFGVTTFSFISLEFCIIILTIALWAYYAFKVEKLRNLFYLLILGYIVSNYTYVFRPENFCILIISIAIALQLIDLNKNLKIFLFALLCVFCGLIHHIGGLFFLILMLYYFFGKEKKYLDFLKFCFFGIVISLILTKGEIFNYLLLPTKYKSEVNNHLSGIHFNLFFKFLVYSGPIIALVLYLYRKLFTKIDFLFIFSVIILLCFFGRSYYMPYLYTLLLFLAVLNYKSTNNLAFSKHNTFSIILTTSSILYSFFILFFIPFLLIFCTPKTSSTWKEVAKTMKEEKTYWKENNKYFVPTELSLDVYDNKQSRLLYNFMSQNDGIQDVSNKVFYITNKDQLKWITKNFETTSKKCKVVDLVEETEGHIVVSSIYKFKIKRQHNIGLWKVEFID
jgi:hypothetical protein